MGESRILGGMSLYFSASLLCICIVYDPCVQAWSKEGHAMTCKIAQVDLAPFLTIRSIDGNKLQLMYSNHQSEHFNFYRNIITQTRWKKQCLGENTVFFFHAFFFSNKLNTDKPKVLTVFSYIDNLLVMHEKQQDLLEPEAKHAVQMLLPDYVNVDLSALCVWPDQVRHWYKYRWTSSLHFIDTPDQACNFNYRSKSKNIIIYLSH